MNIKLASGMVLVETGISIEEMKQAAIYAPQALRVRDEEGDTLYSLALHIRPANATINGFSFTANCLSEEKELRFAIALHVNPSDTLEEAKESLKVEYGQALVSAAKYLPVIKQQIADACEPIDSLLSVLDTPEEF